MSFEIIKHTPAPAGNSVFDFASRWDRNADRHHQRGLDWLAKGFPSYAEGSFRKEAKNRKRAQDFRRVFGPQTPFEAFLQAATADLILNGEANPTKGGLGSLLK